MHAPKPAASLSSSLLAPKGNARPAMRRQMVAGLGPRPLSALDDLGWDDMGEDHEAHAAIPAPSPVAQHIANLQATLAEETPVPVLETAPVPAPTPVVEPAPVAEFIPILAPVAIEAIDAATPRAELASGRKSAFTLRLDAERHLHLRLLSAVTNRSAQQLLITALDSLIAAHPHITELAADPKTRSTLGDAGME